MNNKYFWFLSFFGLALVASHMNQMEVTELSSSSERGIDKFYSNDFRRGGLTKDPVRITTDLLQANDTKPPVITAVTLGGSLPTNFVISDEDKKNHYPILLNSKIYKGLNQNDVISLEIPSVGEREFTIRSLTVTARNGISYDASSIDRLGKESKLTLIVEDNEALATITTSQGKYRLQGHGDIGFIINEKARTIR